MKQTLSCAEKRNAETYFVSDEQTRTLGAVGQAVFLVEIHLPLAACLERLTICEVEHDETIVGVLVVDMGHVDVALLAADVPELEVELVLLLRVELLGAKLD